MYNVVFRTIMVCETQGAVTWTSFVSKADFETWYDKTMRSQVEVVEQGVTENRAMEVCHSLNKGKAALALYEKNEKDTFVDQQLLAMAVADIHAASARMKDPCRFTIVVAGAAGHLSGLLTSQAGASATLYGEENYGPVEGAEGDSGCVTKNAYGKAALAGLLGYKPAKAVSRETAVAMAQAMRAKSLREIQAYDPSLSSMVYGLGLTAAIGTNRERKGAEAVYIAIEIDNADDTSKSGVYVVEAIFERHCGWTRETQDLLCQVFALNVMRWSLGLEQISLADSDLPGGVYSLEKRYTSKTSDVFELRPTPYFLDFAEPIRAESLLLAPYMNELGQRFSTVPLADAAASKFCRIPVSGNPFTEGHRFMADMMRDLGYIPIFEINVGRHPDKGGVSHAEVAARLEHFKGRESVLVTADMSYFVDKAEAYPCRTFAIGYDVAERILDMQHNRCLSDLQRMKELGVRFYVVPRRDLAKGQQDPKIMTCKDLNVPPEFDEMFLHVDGVPPDVSSTKICAALGIVRNK